MFKQITLVRHGRPAYKHSGRIQSNQMGMWIENYNNAPIQSESLPPEELIDLVNQANVIVCSDTRRSVDSANRLDNEKIIERNPALREAGLPFGQIPLIHLKPKVWAVVFRIAWLCGYSKNSESVSRFRSRAAVGASRLELLAEKHERVVFIGHGILNRQISKRLIQSGWRGSKPKSSYWAFSTLERQ